MAVTKIRKISSWTLIGSAIISLVVLCLFFLGGSDEPYRGEYWTPTHLNTLLSWMYVLFALATVATLLFGIWQFASNFKTNPKGGIMGLVVIVLFAGMLFVTYAIGDGTKLPIANEDIQDYNVPFWLKATDMWLYSTYTLVALIILAILAGSVKKVLNR